MNSELWRVISDNEAALEAFNNMRLAQPVKDRLHYFDVAIEGNSQENATLLQKLYVDIISKSNIDFGTIPDSKGNLLKYTNYPTMEDAISSINKIFSGIASDTVKNTNRLHDMIISCRKDFELGYSFDIEILKVTYCTCVMSLHEMINFCIFEYAQRLRQNAGVIFDFAKVKKKDILVLKNVNSLLKAYDNGQWKKMVDTFRKDPTILKAGTANEALQFSIAAGAAPGAFGTAVATAANAIVTSPLFLPLATVAVFILLFILIRGLIYVFYCGAVSIRDYVKTEKALVDITIQNEKTDGTSTEVVKKHSKIADKLQSIANFIEVKILNNDKQAKAELKKSDQENFNSTSISSQAFGAGMTF